MLQTIFRWETEQKLVATPFIVLIRVQCEDIRTKMLYRVPFLFMLGIGFGMMLVSLFVGIYYVMIVGWALFYLFASFTRQLPWEHCNRDWSNECKSEYIIVVSL